jgi:hypothetical protein
LQCNNQWHTAERESTTHCCTEDFVVANGWISGLKKGCSVVNKILFGECKGIDFSAVRELRNEELLKIIQGCESKKIYKADEMWLFFKLSSSKTVSMKGNPHSSRKNSKERITVSPA